MLTMRNYIDKEKETLLKILHQRDQLFLLEKFKWDFSDIVIFATGSSANAANSARLYMQDILKVPVTIKEPSMSYNYEDAWNENTLFFAISQGGHSQSTINLVKKFNDEHKSIYVLTSDIHSPIADISNNIIDLGMGIETMPYVTLGYSVTILVLWLLSLQIALQNQFLSHEEYLREIKDITVSIEAIDIVIEATDRWYNEHKGDLVDKKRFVFIGYGACYGATKEAETKFTETIHLPSNGYELEEYMHGPYLGLDPEDLLVLIDQNGRLHSRMKLLREFLDLHMTKTYKVGFSTKEYAHDLNFHITIPENLSSILLTIPFHIISYNLSQEHKVDLTKSFYPEFDEITSSKI